VIGTIAVMEVASLGALAVYVAVAGTGVAVLAAAGIGEQRLITRALTVAAAAAATATLLLAYALVSGDYSLRYVADTTSDLTPAPYRLAALWGATEGSLLFLAALMATVSAVAATTCDCSVPPQRSPRS
jgi:cytochrome c-type biogenesis protein CcmF